MLTAPAQGIFLTAMRPICYTLLDAGFAQRLNHSFKLPTRNEIDLYRKQNLMIELNVDPYKTSCCVENLISSTVASIIKNINYKISDIAQISVKYLRGHDNIYLIDTES